MHVQIARTRARFSHSVAVLRENVVQILDGHARIGRTSSKNKRGLPINFFHENVRYFT